MSNKEKKEVVDAKKEVKTTNKEEVKKIVEKTVQETVEEKKYTCIQACNMFKINKLKRHVAIKLNKEKILTKFDWEKLIKEQGLM